MFLQGQIPRNVRPHSKRITVDQLDHAWRRIAKHYREAQMADNKTVAYDGIIRKLQIKLARQEAAITETKQHISAMEALKASDTKTRA